MKIYDSSGTIDSFDFEVRRKPVERLIFHRFGGPPKWWRKWAPGKTGLAIAQFFRAHRPGGISRMPYGFVIWEDGHTEQTLHLSQWGWHARGWSRASIAIAVIGDFRKDAPTEAQRDAMKRLAEALDAHTLETYARRVSIHGHTDLPDASKNPDHECPGPLLDLQEIRDHLAEVRSVRLQEIRDLWNLSG